MALHAAKLWQKRENQVVECHLCAHRCRISEGKLGFCQVRENKDGQLYTHTYGRLIAENVDPIEKKPLYHVLPGTLSYSVATIGCNFRCDFCQNWQISQTDREGPPPNWGREASPESIVETAQRRKCKSISFTYTEPTIFFEYAYDTAKLARASGLSTAFVTNGYMTREAIETIRPFLNAANVDLKSFQGSFYRKHCGGRLEPVLESIRTMREFGIWVEVTTLVVPGQNDSPEELNQIAEFIADVDRKIPWHISRFFPQFKLTAEMPTPMETLETARNAGRDHGLEYVYLGNVAGSADTLCPSCDATLIGRSGYRTDTPGLKEKACKACGHQVAGLFD